VLKVVVVTGKVVKEALVTVSVLPTTVVCSSKAIPPAGAIVVALIGACMVAEELLLLGVGGGALSEVEVGSNVVSAAGLLVSVVETWASVEVVSMRRARQQRNIFGSSSMEFLHKFFSLIEFNRVLHKFFSLIKFSS